MFVKQIDQRTAMELAAKGVEVMVLIPVGSEMAWADSMPDTLQHLLEGCMFFRKEPALERDIIGGSRSDGEQATGGESG